MNVKDALIKRKAIIRQAYQQSDYGDRKRYLNAAEMILQQIEKARFNGTAENDVESTGDAFGMMAD